MWLDAYGKKIYEMLTFIKTHLFEVRLDAAERESLRKCLKNFFVKNPNIKNSESINHFEKKRNSLKYNLK